MSLVFSHWVQSLVDYTQKYYWELVTYQLQLKEATQEVEEILADKKVTAAQKMRYIEKKMNYFTPQVNLLYARIGNFNPIYFQLHEVLDNLSDRFDLYIIKDCRHFLEVEDEGLSGAANVYVDVMRDIQTVSALLFLVLVHIPLSRVHSLFSVLTAMLPMTFNLRTKFWFYE